MTQDDFKKQKKQGLNQTFDAAVKVLQEFNPIAIHQFGSGGRGDGDEFSDLDFFVTVKDEDFESIIPKKIDLYTKVSPVLLRLFETEQHPKGWYHDLIIYDTPQGLIHTDYYITPRSKVILPEGSKLIEGEKNLPTGEWTTNDMRDSAGHDLYEAILVMTYIGVKGLIRKWDAGFFDFLRTLYNSYRRDEQPTIAELPNENNFELIYAILENTQSLGIEKQQKANKKIQEYAKEVEELYK